VQVLHVSRSLDAADVVPEDFGADDVGIVENRTGVKLVGAVIIAVGEVSVCVPVKVARSTRSPGGLPLRNRPTVRNPTV
jgi:hypothetical protein